jgi:uncharacterized protein (DUF58 family)
MGATDACIATLNWQASLRSRQLYITQHHEEQNADVILLLDTLPETGIPPHSTIDHSVRAAAALASAYLAHKDRVGFIEFGGHLRLIKPATGLRQAEALIDGLLPAATHFSYVVPRLDRLPPRILPPEALIVAASPLLDNRFIAAVIDLAARGFDVIVVAVSPIEPTRRGLAGSWLDDLGCRLWRMEWRDKTDDLRQRGLVILESRRAACRPRHCSQDRRGRLSHARRGLGLSRSRRGLSRPDR